MHPSVGATSVSLAVGVPFVVGRAGAEVDLALDGDKRISRRHARLIARSDGVWFEDLGSRNGSWVGDTRLAGLIRLTPGMEVLIGETVVALDDGRWQSHKTPPRRAAATRARRPPLVEGTSDLRLDAPAPKPRTQAIDSQLRRVLSAGTADLPPTSVDEQAPGIPAVRRLRQTPEVVREGVVRVRISAPDQLAELWERELSRGSMFVPTNALLALEAKVTVEVVAPHGALLLNARVTSVVGATTSARTGRPIGMVLGFTDLGNSARRVIRDYGEGLIARLSLPGAPLDEAVPTIEERGRLAADLVTAVAAGDCYGALGLAPIAASVEIRTRISSLESLFDVADEEVPDGPLPGVFAAALDAMARLRVTLSDEDRRLAYDLRAGHVRAEERLAMAKSNLGPTAVTLREAWELAWPAQADRAAFLARLAFSHRAKGKLSIAIDAAESALQFHPFYDELRITLRAWNRELDERRAADDERAWKQGESMPV